MKYKRGTFGPLLIELKGTGTLFDRFCDEIKLLDSKSSNANAEADLSIVIESVDHILDGYEPVYSSAKHHMSFNRDTFYYDQPVPFLCTNLFSEKKCELKISDKAETDIKSILKRLLSRSINSRPELSYSLFWYIIQNLLLQKRCSFIHAGILSRDEQAMAFMGTGGSGKTSIMFHLLDNLGYSYMAEDFGIISNRGRTFSSPKTLSIYDSDIQSGADILQNTNDTLTFSEKIRWVISKYVFKQNPMKKIPVSSFFAEDKLGGTCNLSKAFYILRTNCKAAEIHEISREELADRLVNVTLREMKKFIELLNLINANTPAGYPFLTVDQFVNKTKEVYKKAFEEVDLLLLELPFKASPTKVEDFLKSKHLLI